MIVVRLYIGLILLGLLGAIAGVYLHNLLIATVGAAWALFFFALEVGLIIYQYQGLARLMAVHDKLIIASIKAQGFELEGVASLEEEEEAR
jgi:hypothetical protein